MNRVISKKRLIFAGILLIVLSVSVTTCRQAGTWLVKEDTPAHADAMIILMGSISDRVLQAVDLYDNKIAGRVIIVEESMGAYRALERRGAHIISNTIQSRDASVALGIPLDSITILPGDARSTQQEATILSRYLSENPGIDTLLVVSSSEHTRRASLIFRKVFEKSRIAVVICSSPSKYTNYSGNYWWEHKEEIQAVLSEYLKLLNFWIFDIHKIK